MSNPTLRDEIAQVLYEMGNDDRWDSLLPTYSIIVDMYFAKADAVIAVMQKHGYLSKGP